MKHNNLFICLLLSATSIFINSLSVVAQNQTPILPSQKELNKTFGSHDRDIFKSPTKVFYPETWFHFIGGNVALNGITADLEAIAQSGISGIQLFHGQFGGQWPGVDPQMTYLSPEWDKAIRYTAEECRRLGLRFTMQNCPGWAMSGGPWIEPSNAMRHLTWSRTDIKSNSDMIRFSLPILDSDKETWRDYKDVAVIAFPTPLDDTNDPLAPLHIESNLDVSWEKYLSGSAKEPLRLPPTTDESPHLLEVTFSDTVLLRTIEFPSINSMNHDWCYDPGVTIIVQAIKKNGETEDILHTELPQSNWQDNYPISFACSEIKDVAKYRIAIINKHDMALQSLRFFTAARKNNWESEAGWTLRSIVRENNHPKQSNKAFIDPEQIIDLTEKMDDQGNLNWKATTGKWTILRIGHVNTGERNGPAPDEGTGWECNKLSESGAEAQFAGYIGRLSGEDGPLANGLLNGLLLDSWECKTQTWTDNMENEFELINGYPLRKWLPAVFGYVVDNHETSAKFLLDWRTVIGELYSNKFYAHMAKLAKDNDLSITYETAAGDVFPADILEYFKHADVPMCEFWHPISESFVGSLNFKPIKPTASAARMYGKPRVAAEAFTNISLSWDEQWPMLKEAANINFIEGVTHMVFHTYTHNPRTDFLSPGTSFGAGIGTPFLRGQTWWKHMPEFNAYLARCSYLLERGKPVSDVLWYLGDEINHKPDQNAPFPEGFKYDYCNPDVLLNRLIVRDGKIVTPEGISYRVLWLPETQRMRPETLEKLQSLINDGAIVVGEAPKGLATLSGGKNSLQRFNKAKKNIWGAKQQRGFRKVGKGIIISGLNIFDALKELKIEADVIGQNVLWTHRKVEGADWYYIAAPQGSGFNGTLDFKCSGNVEIWDPVTGFSKQVESSQSGNRTQVKLTLSQAESCFVVFNHSVEIEEDFNTPIQEKELVSSIKLNSPWKLEYPSGWGAPEFINITELNPWKDLDVSSEAKAFSGSAVYTTTFDAGKIKPNMNFTLELGDVSMIAVVSLNGKQIGTLWSPPYNIDISDYIRPGINTLTIEVTSTWFNRLVYDAGQNEKNRKTWVINGPSKDEPLRESGLLGPVSITIER